MTNLVLRPSPTPVDNGGFPVTIIIEYERPQSWNKLKRMHKNNWHSCVEVAKMLVLAALLEKYNGNRPEMFACRVDIDVVVYFDKYPYDSSNIPLKLYEDGLIGLLIKDDSPKYVRRVSTESRIDKKLPRVEITVTPIVDDPLNRLN